MTTLHHIGELLRSGVRPTDEETEHLKALGGFVAEMYGRFMGGHAEHLSSSADLFSGKLSSRLSAATGARWEQGLGLAELLLGSELTSFWQIARQGLATGYGDMGAEMGMLELYDEEGPVAPAAVEQGEPRRRRPSLFGKKMQTPSARVRPGVRTKAVGDVEGRADLDLVKPGEARESGVRWTDGGLVEMSVIKALASGGLFIGDQVFDQRTVSDARRRIPAAAGGGVSRVESAGGAAMRDAAGRPVTVDAMGRTAMPPMFDASGIPTTFDIVGAAPSPVSGGRPDASRGARAMPSMLGAVQPVMLDGMRVDGRTPALATALARATAVFGRTGALADERAAVTEARLGRLTAGPGYTLDHGLGQGERPVYGFFDAVETTYLNLVNEAAAAEPAESIARAPRARSSARRPTIMPASARSVEVARAAQSTQDVGVAQPGPVAPGRRLAVPGRHEVATISLDRVVAAGGGLRPFVGGVFPASPRDVARASVEGVAASTSVPLATQVLYGPNGQAVVRVQRGGMSAPRYSVVEAGQGGRVWAGAPSRTMAATVLAGASLRNEGGATVPGTLGAAFAGGAGSGRATVPATLVGVGRVAGGLGDVKEAAEGATSRDARMGAAAMSRWDVTPSSQMIGGDSTLGVGASGVRADWRLAADGGADMPLGATFSRHEVFAGTRSAQSVADIRSVGSDFKPVVARGGQERPSELAQVLDGLVWVTLPEEAGAAEPVGPGLVSVPSRRSAMVPAGLAFQSIASATASRGAAARLQADLLSGVASERRVIGGVARPAGVPEGASPMVGRSPDVAVRGTSTEVAAGPEMLGPRAADDRIVGAGSIGFDGRAFAIALRSGLLGGVASGNAAGVASVGAGAIGAGGHVRAGAVRAGGQVGAGAVRAGGQVGAGAVRAGGQVGAGAFRAGDQVGAGAIGAGDQVGAGAIGAGDQVGAGAIGAGDHFGAGAIGTVDQTAMALLADRGVGSAIQGGHIVAAALGADGIGRGLRAMRFLEAAVGRGGYGHIESERELLSIAETVTPSVAGEGTTERADGRRGRASSASTGSVMFSSGASRRSFATAAGAAQAAADGTRVEDLFDRVETLSPFVAAASAARAALRRPVVTARESRQVAAAFGERGAVAAQAGRGVAATFGDSGVAQAGRSVATTFGESGVTAAFGASGVAAAQVGRGVAIDGPGAAIQRLLGRGLAQAGVDEPVLGRLVQRMNALRAEQPSAARWETPTSIIDRLGGLVGEERRAVARAFAASGWSASELEMLRLEAPVSGVIEAGAAVAPGRLAGRRGPAPRGVEADTKETIEVARAERLGRSLARVLTGTEALGGDVADRQAGASSSSFAQGVAATWLPLLGRGADYFGGLAPSTARGAYGGVSLRDAVGDLVKMAEAAVPSSDTAVSLAARRQVLKRATAFAERTAAMQSATGGSPAGARAQEALRKAQFGRGGAAADVADVVEDLVGGAAGVRDRVLGGVESAVPSAGVMSEAGRKAGFGMDRASAFAEDRIAALAAERVSSLSAGGAGSSESAFGWPDRVGGPGAQRDMQIGDLDRTMVGLEREPVGLEARLAEALALSAGGPAGARRMMRQSARARGAAAAFGPAEMALASGRELAAARRLDAVSQVPGRARAERPGELVTSSEGARTQAASAAAMGMQARRTGPGRGRDVEAMELARVAETVLSGASPERTQVRLGVEARHDAAIREESRRALSIRLGSVMAPEAMLGGLRSPELTEAMRAVATRQATYGFDAVPVLTTLADSGVDLEAARSSIAAVHGAGGPREVGAIGRAGEAALIAAGEGGAGLGELRASRASAGALDVSALAGRSPEQAFVRMLAEPEAAMAAVGASLGRQRRAGLLSAILRGTERAEMTALLEQAGGREFAFAWLNRVDGSRSGLDIGMQSTRKEFGQAFGRRDSAMAGESPIQGASLVDTSARSEDKSGLRSVAAAFVHTATGAARPQHGASQAIRRTDWSFVDTGSRASTAHADLTKLSAAIIGSADSAQRAPMPLVAPAAKAVAQTALRAAKTESASQTASTQPAAPSGGDKRGPVDAKMSEKAIEMLAIEMASRVARLMGLMNERRGVWS